MRGSMVNFSTRLADLLQLFLLGHQKHAMPLAKSSPLLFSRDITHKFPQAWLSFRDRIQQFPQGHDPWDSLDSGSERMKFFKFSERKSILRSFPEQRI